MLNEIVDPLEALRLSTIFYRPCGADRLDKIDHVLAAPPTTPH